jgi:acid phosphatase (class A)
MNISTDIISDINLPYSPFPENSNRKTILELEFLINYNNNQINKDFVKKGDNILKVFKNYCEDNNLEFDNKYYKKVLDESSKTILQLKYYYNRPRPYQLAEYYGLKEFEGFELGSMKTPSYPSGHSTQGHLMAELLGAKYNGHYDKFKSLADMISASRLMARAHYPSDIEFGEKVSKYIFNNINGSKLWKK